MLSNVLDTKGEGVGGSIPIPRWGTFLDLGLTKTRLWVHYKVKINN